jgi:hypothetical protein
VMSAVKENNEKACRCTFSVVFVFTCFTIVSASDLSN